MKCRDFEGHLSAYIAEKTAPDLRRSIKGHLKACKKCRARLALLKIEKNGQSKEEESSGALENATPLSKQTVSPSSPGNGVSALWRRPLEMTVTVVLIGGTFLLYQRGTSDLKTDIAMVESPAPPVAEASAVSIPDQNDLREGKESQIPPSPPPQTVPVDPPAPPMKIHQATSERLPKEVRRKTASSRSSEIKLLLISRNIQEAVDTLGAEVKEFQGKVLSKKGDEMETKMVLLIPAERYETFSKALQSVGLVKDISGKQPPSEGSLKIEVTIE